MDCAAHSGGAIVKPAPFDYACPATIMEALELLGDPDTESKVLAGGQSLVPLLSMRLARPQRLVDVNRIPELTYIQSARDGTHFGAMTRQSDLIRQSDHPLIAHAAGWIGHAAIRSRGTLGGSIVHADPSAELPAVALACNAQAEVATASGPTTLQQGPNKNDRVGVDNAITLRTVPAPELFEGALQTTLADGDLLTSVSFAVPGRWGFAEMARRQGDFALVLAVVAELADGWRVVVGGVDSTPWRCAEAEAILDRDEEPSLSAIATAVQDTCPSFDDLHAPADYRRSMAAHHVQQAAADAVGSPR